MAKYLSQKKAIGSKEWRQPHKEKDVEDSISGIRRTEPIIVAALDFGTTYSGYAFSFKHEYKSSPLTIHTNQWQSGGHGFAGVNLKTPSCLLLHPDKTLHSFGYEAKNKYEALSEMNEHKDWYFFWQFKMILHHQKKITGNYKIKEENGKSLESLTVFSLSIQYLKDHLVKMVQNSTPELREREITWVITVPAIWQDSAKKFMRKAAEKAGIDKDKIEIALEPESASLYCRQLSITRDPQTGTGMTKFATGTRYIILDCGGGTVDVTVHEVMEHNKLKELHAATGGNWGGTKVNKSFFSFISKFVGSEVFNRFSKEYKSEYLNMQDDFESKKRMTTPELQDMVTIRIPIQLHSMFKSACSRELAEEALRTTYRSEVKVVSDKMRIAPDVFRSFFKEAVREIVNHVKKLLETLPLPVESILLVGGFSESPVLQKAIKDNFSSKYDVIIPLDASMCVLKGAVLYGHDPTKIIARKSPYTYGVAMTVSFRKGIHPENKKLTIDGEELCDDVFDKHVEVGQTVNTGEVLQERTYFPLTDQDTFLPVVLFRSSEKDPKFIDDRHCHIAGNFLVKIKPGGSRNDRKLKVRMIFGSTDIIIEAIQVDGSVHRADFTAD